MSTSVRALWKTLCDRVSGRAAVLRELHNYASTFGKMPGLLGQAVGRSIAMSDVFPWHELSGHRFTTWERDVSGRLRGSPSSSNIFKVTRRETLEHASLSLFEIEGLGSCTDPIEDFTDMDAFALAHCAELMKRANDDKVLALMSDPSVRLWVEGVPPRMAPDTLVWHQWDERVMLSNAGRPYALVAARSLAKLAGSQIIVGGPMVIHRIDMAAAMELTSKFHLFYVGSPGFDGHRMRIIQIGRSPDHQLYELMDKLQAPWGFLELPANVNDAFMLVLPRGVPESDEVADVLRAADVTDAGLVLQAAGLNQVPMYPRYAHHEA
ncbi:hypothetical protein ABIC83_002818 [Roseateles asaccharophilus]|uniref:DUF6685 family protein n=1 Tax=Roseateles asaccharophilus TaxID=582607 RepID=UPI00383277C2